MVILDNPGRHNSRDTRAAIRRAGAQMIFLPPNSPDLTPMKLVFATLKHVLRAAAVRSQEAVMQGIATIRNAYTPKDCANDLANARYASI